MQWVLDEAGQLASPMSIRATRRCGALLLMARASIRSSAEEYFSDAVPSPAEFLADAGARADSARPDGTRAWSVLRRVLLGADGPAIRGGRNESLWVATLARSCSPKSCPRGRPYRRVGAVAMIGAAPAVGSL